MRPSDPQNSINKRIMQMAERAANLQENDLYFYNQPIREYLGGAKVLVNGRRMDMFASYSYLGLISHPKINQAAKDAIDHFGTGTHGVRSLAGSLTIHKELEEKLADFKKSEDAITYSSGYATNLSVISTLVGRGDIVYCDKLNHASIYDGCLMSRARFERFNHNDLDDLEACLKCSPEKTAKFVVVDAVFSMDGDIIDLPRLADLCRRYHTWLMVDEAHSLGVLGKTGHGIEEHYGLYDAIDIRMGTLSKTIPAAGGYVAGARDVISFLRHASRAYIFSAALTPPQAAAARAALEVIEEEPWRVNRLHENTQLFIQLLQLAGFDTMKSSTAIAPILCGEDETAYRLTAFAQHKDLFVLPVVSPAVPEGLARLRTTVTAAHEPESIRSAVERLQQSAQEIELI